MEPEGARLQQQRIEERFRQPLAPVGKETFAHQQEVFDKLVRVPIGGQGRERRFQGAGFARCDAQRVAEPRAHAGREPAVHIKLKMRVELVAVRGPGLHLAQIAVQLVAHACADPDLLRRAGKQPYELFQAALIVREKPQARGADGRERDLWRDERVAVAVAADPRAEPEQHRHLREPAFHAVLAPERVGELAVQGRERREDGNFVIVEAHFGFIGDGRLSAADLVRLPQRGDLRGELRLQPRELLVGQRNAVERLEQLAHAPPLGQDGPPRDLGRVRREHWRDDDLRKLRERFVRQNAGLAHSPESAAERSALPGSRARDLRGGAASFAVVGFGQVGQLEVKRERA